MWFKQIIVLTLSIFIAVSLYWLCCLPEVNILLIIVTKIYENSSNLARGLPKIYSLHQHAHRSWNIHWLYGFSYIQLFSYNYIIKRYYNNENDRIFIILLEHGYYSFYCIICIFILIYNFYKSYFLVAIQYEHMQYIIKKI
jgi:hypothetical protein